MDFKEFERMELYSDVSNTELAQVLGVAKSTISYYKENGIPFDKVQEIAKHYGKTLKVSVQVQLDEDNEHFVFSEALVDFAKIFFNERKKNNMSLETASQLTGLDIGIIKKIEYGTWTNFTELYIYMRALGKGLAIIADTSNSQLFDQSIIQTMDIFVQARAKSEADLEREKTHDRIDRGYGTGKYSK